MLKDTSLRGIIGWFSKCATAIPTTKTVSVKALIEVQCTKIFLLDLPESIIGDRGSCLTAASMRQLCKALSTLNGVSYHSQIDG